MQVTLEKSALYFFLYTGLILLSAYPSNAQSIPNPSTFTAKPLVRQLNHPWAIEFLSDHELLLSERRGELIWINLKTLKKTFLKGVPSVGHRNQGGLLDIKLHPNFKHNRILFLSYTIKKEGLYSLQISQFELDLDQKIIKHQSVLYTATPFSDEAKHFGSRFAVNQDYLFFGIGDRGDRKRAQKLDDSAGKVIRLKLDGSIPNDNPFIQNKSAKPEIYSLGHRNPQGIYLDALGQLWLQEHGPRGGDELNKVLPGKNYGWPIITYGKEYWGPSIGEGTHKAGLEQPAYHWTPSIAPSGLLIYSGKKHPDLKGCFINGALKLRHLNVLIKQKEAYKEIRLFESMNNRIRDVDENTSGDIYFITDSPEGTLYKIERSL